MANALVRCRVGSSEIKVSADLTKALVRCRVGSSETIPKPHLKPHPVRCRVGSSEMKLLAKWDPRRVRCRVGNPETSTIDVIAYALVYSCTQRQQVDQLALLRFVTAQEAWKKESDAGVFSSFHADASPLIDQRCAGLSRVFTVISYVPFNR